MRYLPKAITFYCAAFLSTVACAQVDRLFRTDADYISRIKVTENGNEKTLSWAGGLNHPQFAVADLNKDGKKDLVVYEVNDIGYQSFPLSNNVKTFINTGTPGSPQFNYAPEFEYLIPYPGRFMKMLDHNCDQVPDLLYGSGFLNICDGYYNSDNNLAFKNCRSIRYVFPSGTNSSEVPILTDDIPGIEDLNADNDLDLVTFSSWLNGKMELYRNMRFEEGLLCDSVRFKFKDRCWGKVSQDAPRAHLLGISCDNTGLKTSEDQNKLTHGSNGICLFDADGDGDYDVLMGNSYYSDIQFLKNGRVEYNHPVDSIISQDTIWQSNGHQLSMSSYPMAYWIDVDGDNDRDILIAPQSSGQNYRSVAFYKNTGTDLSPAFVYQSDTFLVEDMIDAGSNSYPYVYDYNKDGRKDLFVGARGFYQQGGTHKTAILYFENTSTGSDISFNLVTRDFLNISSFPGQGAAIAIGDLDNDGLDDLVAGRLDGSVICYKNYAAGANVQPVWQLWQPKLKDSSSTDIYTGNYAAPFIYDIDKDGKNDLIVGNETGYLTYYKNIGNTGQLNLAYRTNKLGGVKAVPDAVQGYSAPYIGPIDNTGNEYLMVGSGTGAIYRYTGFQNGNVTGLYTVLDTLYSGIRIPGEFSSASFANIFGDGKYELFIGNGKGGVFAYRQVWDVHVDDVVKDANRLTIFPNPARNEITIITTTNLGTELQLYDNLGRLVPDLSYTVDINRLTINISALPTGIYLCTLRDGIAVKSGLFVKE